jgi:hypothetical protein
VPKFDRQAAENIDASYKTLVQSLSNTTIPALDTRRYSEILETLVAATSGADDVWKKWAELASSLDHSHGAGKPSDKKEE